MSTAKTRPAEVIAGLDIGTTKVTMVIAHATPDGVEIVGRGTAINSGTRHGVIANIEAVKEAISKAREEAELMSGVQAHKVWLAIGGTHIQSFDSMGMIAVKGKEVTQDDVNRVIEAAKAIALPSDRQVLHVLPKEYKLDNQDGISDPMGMSGVRLEANVHIVTGHHNTIQNFIKCVEQSGLQIANLVYTPLASAAAVLSGDERHLGVTVVDIGGGTCDMITYYRNSVVHSACMPIGGINFTHDVAVGLRTTQNYAEIVKKKFGAAMLELAGGDDSFEVDSVGGRSPRVVAKSNLCKILEARADETLKLIQKEINERGWSTRLGSGIVLTGGGAELRGLVEMGDFIFDVPVRLGTPQRIKGLVDVVAAPEAATAVGLLFWAYDSIKPTLAQTDLSFEMGERMEDWGRKLKNLFQMN
jgi:cell division protein FtsA